MDALLDSPTRIHDTYETARLDKTILDGQIVALTKEKYELFRKLPYGDDKEIERDIHRLIRNGSLSQAYARTVDAVESKTNLFAEYEELQLIESLLWELQESEYFEGARVRWDYGLPEGVGAEYVPERRQINSSHKKPNRVEALRAFATTGNFPMGALKLVHEYSHSRQLEPGKKIEKSDQFSKNKELHEAQAYKMGDLQIGAFPNSAIADIMKRSGLYGEKEDRLAYALDAIDCMVALRYDMDEITDLVRRPGNWDSKIKCYTRIQEDLERELKIAGFDADDLEKLLEAHRLERQITYLKVMHIAQREIMSRPINTAA